MEETEHMTLLDHVTELPMPARLQRGTPKRSITITISEVEDDLIAHLADKLPLVFDKKKSEVIRAALMVYAWDLEDLVENDWKPVIQQLKDIHRRSNYLQSKEAIADFLDRKADVFNTLLDFGNFDGALEEYSRYMNEVAQLPTWWQEIINTMAADHTETQRFFSRVDQMGHEAIIALKEVMDRIE